MKTCLTCGEPKPVAAFYPRRGSCRACVIDRVARRRAVNWPKERERRREFRAANRAEMRTRQQRYFRRVQAETFEAYGGKCACCGEADPRFLTLDHVNRDGGAARRAGDTGVKLWIRLRREDYPGYIRLLCFNCNCGRERNRGVCPHEDAVASGDTRSLHDVLAGSHR